MAIPNLLWRNVEVVSAPPPLYLNYYYHKLAMIAKPSIERMADMYRNIYLWLRRDISCILLTVIDRRNIIMCSRTNHVYRPIPSVEAWERVWLYQTKIHPASKSIYRGLTAVQFILKGCKVLMYSK